MKSRSVNLTKIEKMAYLALKNGLRLHKDSIILFNKKRYPSAYFFSILAVEEVGKFFLLEDFWWHSIIEGRMEGEWEERFLGLIYSHREKQWNFTYNFDGPLSNANFAKSIVSGRLEKVKQNAIYVGLPKQAGKVKLRGRINNPSNITRKRAEKQITDVNDRIIKFILGVSKDIYSVETVQAQKMLNRNLYKRLRKEWPMINKSTMDKLKEIDGF